jgi:hypothetical protein
MNQVYHRFIVVWRQEEILIIKNRAVMELVKYLQGRAVEMENKTGFHHSKREVILLNYTLVQMIRQSHNFPQSLKTGLEILLKGMDHIKA